MTKNKIIIVFSGKQFSGKDTVAKILLNSFKTFKRVGIADAIKRKYSFDNGVSLSEIEKNKSLYRQDLINLGNWGRAKSPDFWLKEISQFDGNIIVTDVRMKHELNFFRSFGAFCIRVEASIEARSKRGIIASSDDNTETELDNISDWDYVIHNEGDYSELEENSKLLVKSIINKYGDNL